MEKDLKFLINALAVPHSPLTRTYNQRQLLEMRESFVTLQQLLRRNRLAYANTKRSKFSSDSTTKRLYKTLAINLRPVRHMIDEQFRASGHTVPSSSISLDEHGAKEPRCFAGQTTTATSCSGMASNSSVPARSMSDTDTDVYYDTSEDCLVLPPSVTSDEVLDMVPYVPLPELKDTSSAFSMFTVTETSRASVSIRMPLQLQYVWKNAAYNFGRTDSESTLRPDGGDYITKYRSQAGRLK